MISDQQPAHRIQPGSFVRADIDGREVICLKVERLGRDFVNHYIVPMDPLPYPREDLALHYIDPAEPLPLCEEPLELRLEAAEAERAEVGAVVLNPRGHYLKVRDTASTGRTFAYVELASGMVLGRQERSMTGVLRWRLVRGEELAREDGPNQGA